MRDDDLVDGLLEDAMSAEAPELPSGFEARVMQRLRPRRLTRFGRVLMVAYSLAAFVTAAWLMRDLPVGLIAAAVGMAVPVAVGASAYVRRIAASY